MCPQLWLGRNLEFKGILREEGAAKPGVVPGWGWELGLAGQSGCLCRD